MKIRRIQVPMYRKTIDLTEDLQHTIAELREKTGMGWGEIVREALSMWIVVQKRKEVEESDKKRFTEQNTSVHRS